jgi:hypothetical protein
VNLSIAADRCRLKHGDELRLKIRWEWVPVFNMDSRMLIAWARCDECRVMHQTRATVTAEMEMHSGLQFCYAIRDKCIVELERYLAPKREKRMSFGDIYETLDGTRMKQVMVKPFTEETKDGEARPPAPAPTETV